MAKYTSDQADGEAARIVAMIMAASARTAPKTRGLDCVKTLILDGEDLQALAAHMEKAESKSQYTAALLKGNAKNVRVSSCVLLVGVAGNPKRIEAPLDCGACGYEGCSGLAKVARRTKVFTGPTCMFQALDLGIALGSAVKISSEFNIDSRIMYSIGVAAKEMQLLDSDIIIGVPLSVTGKSPYFDRPKA